MRRQLSALSICALTLVLVAARCGRDEDDGTIIGAYPKVEGEDLGAGAAAPPDDTELVAPVTEGNPAAGDKSKGSGVTSEPADDLFADPLDGSNAKVDGGAMLDDQSTFEPGNSGLPNAVGPDGDSLPQVPGPDSDGTDFSGGLGPDLTE